MKRDGFSISLWQHGMPPYSARESLLPPQTDVVIVGGGITGLTTALKLQKAGKNCVVLEAQEIGFGTTGGTTAHLNTFFDTPFYKIAQSFGEKNAQLVANIAHRSIEQIDRYVEEFNIDCGFETKNAYLFSQNGEQSIELEKIIDSAKKVKVEMEYCASLPIAIPFKKVARVANQSQMHATKYLYGIARAFESIGGVIIQNCRVTDINTGAGAAKVITSMGDIAAEKVVYATHIPPGVNMLHFRCAPYRSYVLALKLKDNNYPDAMVYDLEEPYHYYRTQEITGVKYLIAGGEDHKTGHKSDTNAPFEVLENYVRKYFDVECVAFKWSSQYFEPADGLPYIGHLPGNADNIFVATGFGGNGMIYGTAAAEVLADLICNGESEFKHLFNPARIKPVAGFENVMKETADVASVFVAGWFDKQELEGLEELANSQAMVANYRGKSVAVYKDEVGKVFFLNPACPHIKCTVAWNAAEKSWDCPCHGSRFSFTGELLTAPACKNLDILNANEETS